MFVDGMPPYWDEDRVKEHFKDYGEIEGIVLARNMPTAKRMDFGFVNYTTHEAAVACAEAVNNTELGDGKSKVTHHLDQLNCCEFLLVGKLVAFPVFSTVMNVSMKMTRRCYLILQRTTC